MPSAYTQKPQCSNPEVLAPETWSPTLWCAGRKLLETSDTIGTFARPAKPIILYEFEGCPFCRKVLSGPRRVLLPIPLECLGFLHLQCENTPQIYLSIDCRFRLEPLNPKSINI